MFNQYFDTIQKKDLAFKFSTIGLALFAIIISFDNVNQYFMYMFYTVSTGYTFLEMYFRLFSSIMVCGASGVLIYMIHKQQFNQKLYLVTSIVVSCISLYLLSYCVGYLKGILRLYDYDFIMFLGVLISFLYALIIVLLFSFCIFVNINMWLNEKNKTI